MAISGGSKNHDQPGALAGLIFIGIGALGLVAGRDLSFGNLDMMGPGFLPRALSIAVLIVGSLTIGRALLSAKARQINAANLRAIVCIVGSVGGFAWVNAFAGYLAASVFLIVVSSLARPEPRWKEIALLAGLMTTATTLIFIFGLGVQLRLF